MKTYNDMLDYWEEANIAPPTRKIVCAACVAGDLIIAGARHWDSVMNNVLDTLQAEGSKLKGKDFKQGFIDQYGIYLSREDAMKVALSAGQDIDIERCCGGSKTTLYSEGLY